MLLLGVAFYEVSLPRNVFFVSEGSPTSLFRTYMIKHWPLEQSARTNRTAIIASYSYGSKTRRGSLGSAHSSIAASRHVVSKRHSRQYHSSQISQILTKYFTKHMQRHLRCKNHVSCMLTRASQHTHISKLSVYAGISTSKCHTSTLALLQWFMRTALQT